MSTAPQGLFKFRGLTQILGGSFTLSHGITPSYAVIRCAPQNNLAAAFSDLQITYGTQQPITFRDCRLDLSSLQVDSSGQIWTIRIADRRWRWEYPVITGLYNKIKANGRIDIDTEKTPQELATLLLQEMGESGFDVSDLPNDHRPLVDWQHDNAAEELARLCDLLGCRVVFCADDKVRIYRLGQGKSLPQGQILGGGYSFDPPEIPDALLFVCGHTRYQARIALEAIGFDLNGKVKLIKDLTYNPYGSGEQYGWINQHPDTFPALLGPTTVHKQIRAVALENVYRRYRIKEMATGDMEVPRYGPIQDIKQLLPLSDILLDYETPLGDPFSHAMHAQIYGKFYDTTSDPATLVNTPRGTRYMGSWSLDEARGIITFADPVYQQAMVTQAVAIQTPTGPVTLVSAGSYAYWPAELFIECTFSVRDFKNRQPHRHTVKRNLANGKFRTQPKTVKRDDIYLTVKGEYVPYLATNWGITDQTTFGQAILGYQPEVLLKAADNLKGTGTGKSKADADKGLTVKINDYLDAEVAKYQPKKSVSYKYPMIRNDIDLDGRIHQITWTVGESGATTEASENNEFKLTIPDHQQRRLMEIAKRERDKITGGSAAAAACKDKKA